jgi:flagellar hook-basal body complex protein FliE
MANMSIENMAKTIDSADTEKFFGGGEKRTGSRTDKNLAADPDLKGVSAPMSGDQGKTFSDILRNSVEKVNEMQTQADTAVKELVAGRSKNIHETMLTIERADTSLKLMMQVRNKILDAYREIMRMQV